MATRSQSTQGRKSAVAADRRTVMLSVRLDVTVHNQLSVACGLAGKDKSRFVAEIIAESVRGIVIIDRRGRAEETTPPSESPG